MKKILFITKNYPPQKWGMEQYSYDLYHIFSKNTKTYLIANTRWKYFLPLFGIIAVIQWLYLACFVDVIYIGDGSISFIWYILGKIFQKKIYITVHGLDITWNNTIYQKIVPKIISKYDKIICVSQYTKEICIKKWVLESKIIVINNWIDFDKLPLPNSSDKNEILTNLNIDNFEWKHILFTLGRFIERKWIHQFLESIFANLPKDKYIYIIGWFWAYESIYREIIENNILDNVYLIWKKDKQTIANISAISDIFIMPNIQIPNNIEWFWIVAIEAWYYGLPVFASNIEWIKDAVLPGKTWILINDNVDRNANWISQIEWFDDSQYQRDMIKNHVFNNFSLERVWEKYKDLIAKD